MNPNLNVNVRQVYNLLDLIGDLGGVIEIFMLLMSFIVSPISQFSFNMEALYTLYVAKTSDANLFK